MIKFFRNIRQNLLNEGKTSKYLKYAIGEIILVVIGILIALQINNWNENRKVIIKEIAYLTNIKEEIKNDSIFFTHSWFKNYNEKIKGLKIAKEYIQDNYTIKDTIMFINTVSYGGKYSNITFGLNSRTYEELVSTGNLSSISSENIRNQIVDYYRNVQFINLYADDLRSGYASYFNSLKVYNPKEPSNIDGSEIYRILKKIHTNEFHNIINKELTYTYSINTRLEDYRSRSHKLFNNIEKYLESKN